MRYSVSRFLPRLVHKMGITYGHLKGAVPEPVCNHKLALAAPGKPGGIGMAQGMKDYSLPAVGYASIQAKIVHRAGESIRHFGQYAAIFRWEKKVRGQTARKIAQGIRYVLGKNCVASIAAFGLPDMEGHLRKVHIAPAKPGDLSKAQTAMEADHGHEPCLFAAPFDFGKQRAGFIGSEETGALVVEFGQGYALKRHGAGVLAPN